MRFTADRKTLAQAAKSVIVPPANTHIAVLHGIHIEADRTADVVTLTGSNLDLTCTVDVRCDVDNGGVVIIPAKLLAGFLNNGPAELVTIETGDGDVTLTCGESVATVRTLDAEHWPKSLTVDTEHITLSAADVRRIGSVLFAVDTKNEAKKAYLTGVHLADKRAEATDSYQLAVAALDATVPEMIVPAEVLRRVLAAVAGADEILLQADGQHATFSSDTQTWTTTLLAAEYPNVGRFLGMEPPIKLRFTTGELLDALKRIDLLEEQAGSVTFVPDGGKVVLTRRTDVGEVTDVVPCTVDGDPPSHFSANLRYFAEVVAEHDEETLTLELTDALKPMQVRTADARHVSILMPIVVKRAAS